MYRLFLLYLSRHIMCLILAQLESAFLLLLFCFIRWSACCCVPVVLRLSRHLGVLPDVLVPRLWIEVRIQSFALCQGLFHLRKRIRLLVSQWAGSRSPESLWRVAWSRSRCNDLWRIAPRSSLSWLEGCHMENQASPIFVYILTFDSWFLIDRWGSKTAERLVKSAP